MSGCGLAKLDGGCATCSGRTERGDSRFVSLTRRQALRGGAGLALAAGGLASVAQGPTRAGAAGATDVAGWDAVSALLAGAVEDGTVEGVGLVVVTAGGTPYLGTFGGFTPETVVPIASATKLPSATAIMALVDDGLVRLDEPIATYLPEFESDPAKAAITLRHCLAHTSGLLVTHPSLAAFGAYDGLTLASAVEQIAEAPLVASPGSHFAYGGASYQVAGRVAEVVTGQTWATLFAEQIANRVGMSSFSYGETANPRIGGGGVCALGDYANLLRLHLGDGLLDGRRILSSTSIAEMRRDQLRGATWDNPGTRTKPEESGYGLGWWFDALDATGTPVQFSDAGAFGAIPWLDRVRGYAAFLLIQDRLATGVAFYNALVEPIRDAIEAEA